jgi:ankyrin repeat protein
MITINILFYRDLAMNIPPNHPESGAKNTEENKHKTPAATPHSPNSKLNPHKATANKSWLSPMESVERHPSCKNKSLKNRVEVQGRVAFTSTPIINIESILKRDDVEQLQQLISTDSSEKQPMITDSKKRTLLHKASEYGASNCIKMLIEKLPDDLYKKDADDCLPLHIAASKGHTDCIKILVEINPDTLQHQDRFGQTPVLLAAKYGKTDSLRIMLSYEKREETTLLKKDNQSRSPAHWAAKNGNTDCIMILDEKYPNAIQSRDNKGLTPIHHAAVHGHTQCIEFIAKQSPKLLNHALSDEKKPFQLAIQHGQTKALKAMLNQPLMKKQLTQFKSYNDFITENNKYAQVIKNAREKNKMPFKPVKDFDIGKFNAAYSYHPKKQSLTVEALTDSNTSGKQRASKYSAIDRLNLNPQVETTPDELNMAKALLAGLGSVGVYARCKVFRSAEKNKFWSMGDASACINIIKTLASLGAKNIHVQLSPPDDSRFNRRQIYNTHEKEQYNEKQHIALSKLAYLLPEFNINHGTPQKISLFGSQVTISCCDDPVKDTPVTLSFLTLSKKHDHCNKCSDENYIHLKPYRFNSQSQMIFTDIEGNNCNISPINAPTNSVLTSLDTNRENDVIKPQSGDNNKKALFDSINQLCNYSKNKQALVGVVYGLHHSKITQKDKITMLINWIDAIKPKVEKIKNSQPVVIICTANSIDDPDILKKVVESTGVKVVNFSNKNDIDGFIPLKSDDIVLGIMPSLPQPVFNKMVSHSNLPTLAEGANLTSFLLQNGHPHLSLLPSGQTPVAQNMGYPLEALKAQAFSYKLVISKEGEEKNKLEKLLELVKKNKYQEALSFVKEIKEGNLLDHLIFLWKTPQPSDLQLKSVTIMSLLEKGESLGSIEKEALISAIDPSDEALANYIESCLDEDSPTTDHFQLQQMHVGQSFNHTVASALVKFGRYKKLLPKLDKD